MNDMDALLCEDKRAFSLTIKLPKPELNEGFVATLSSSLDFTGS
jgi:hypothetical protein